MADLGFTFNGDDYPDIGPLSAIDELRLHQQWVCWALVTRPGAAKPTKPPMSPHTGRQGRTPSHRIGEATNRPMRWPRAATSRASGSF